MPNSEVSKSLAYYENAILDQKITDLKKEVKKLEELAEINKIRKLDNISNRIQEVKFYFGNTCSELKKYDFMQQKKKYKQIENSYEELLKYQNDKEKGDRNSDKPKKNIINKDEKAILYKQPQKTEEIKTNIHNIMRYMNESLQNTNNLTFKEWQELMNTIIQNEKEHKKFDDYKLICDDVRKKAEGLLIQKPNETVIIDMREIDNELSNVIKNINVIIF
jgi:hypothetical protein